MADNYPRGNQMGVVDRDGSTAAARNSGTANVTTPAQYVDITTMRAALTASNAGTYTALFLNTMTFNDMVYAYRMLTDPGGIKYGNN